MYIWLNKNPVPFGTCWVSCFASNQSTHWGPRLLQPTWRPGCVESFFTSSLPRLEPWKYTLGSKEKHRSKPTNCSLSSMLVFGGVSPCDLAMISCLLWILGFGFFHLTLVPLTLTPPGALTGTTMQSKYSASSTQDGPNEELVPKSWSFWLKL